MKPTERDDPAPVALFVGLHDLFERSGEQDVVAAEEPEELPSRGE